MFYLCRWCDCGDRYCSDDCADAGRRDSLLTAGRAYQRTEAGRANHAARQQEYLDKREAAKMTHQSAENLPQDVEVVLPAPVSLAAAYG